MSKGTVIVYWNATKFTRYENLDPNQVTFGDHFLVLKPKEAKRIVIPWTTINRVEVIDD